MAEPESLHQGGTAVLNISSEGMLLHMPKAYDPGSIIEVNLADARNGRFTTILEARWSKFHKLPERPFEYLIGCRALFAIFS